MTAVTSGPDTQEASYGPVIKAFKEVARAATDVRSPDSLDNLLRLVGQRICELVGVVRCSVYLHGDDGLFHGRVGYAATGCIDDRIKPLISGIDGDRFTHEIVATRAPVLVTDARHDQRTLQRTMRRWNVRDMLGVPLVVGDEVIGIIYVDNQESDHFYSEHDLHVTQTFASLAAIAIMQASLVSQLTERATVIDQQRQVLQQAAEAHERLTRAVLSGLGSDAIVGLLADLLTRPVLAFSENLELMASAAPDEEPVLPTWVLAARGRGDALVSAAVRRVVRSKPSVLLGPASDLGCPHRRLVCPMLVEGHVGGYLVVLDRGRPFDALDVRIGQHGATVLTVQLFTELRQDAARVRARQEFLGDLLHGGRDVGSLERRARVIGVDLGSAHLLVRVTGDASRLVTVLADELGIPEPLTTTVPGAFVALVPLAGDDDHSELRQVRDIVRKSLGGDASAVLSGPCRRPSDYPRAHVEARRTTEFLKRLGGEPGVEMVSEMGVLRLLSTSTPRGDLLAFARDLLVPLVRHDEQTQGELVATLRALLDSGGQIRSTAKALGVHENTVRYRLSRVSKLSAVDPERLERLLDLRLALQILDLAGESDKA